MYAVLVAVFGLIWGSFLSVIGNRTRPAGSILIGRSICPNCRHKLGALDLIPLLSFAMLRGRCRYCKKRISLAYPMIEIFSLVLAFSVYLKIGLSLQSVILFLSFSLLLLSSVQDVEEKEVEVWYFITGIALALAFAFWGDLSSARLTNLLYAIVTAGIGPFLLYLVSRETWMGLGDTFFAIWIGILVGFPTSLFAVFLAFLIGAVFGIIILIMRRGGLKTQVPFGPYLAVSGLIGFLVGGNVIDWYLRLMGF